MSQCKHGTTETPEKVCRICSEARIAELEGDLAQAKLNTENWRNDANCYRKALGDIAQGVEGETARKIAAKSLHP